LEQRRDLQIHYVLFAILITIICVMSLLHRDSLNGIYLYFAHLLSIDPLWVSGNNATCISNSGHIAACFTLTWLAFQVFRKSYFKTVFFVTGLACLGEFAQFFTVTRQAKLEDVLFSFSGILLASLLIIFLKQFTFSTQFNKR